ncbi:condensation domain-containing protein, partial [Flavobacterium sp. CSZ]|uniref:condensation domain-containing protein n=1 Tax=Flavobacterium sp. CSZ TaxID=2783791 RepID=UPI001A0AD701
MLDFIEELESKNIRVSLKGQDLEINFDGELDNEIIARLKDKKQELIQFLSENAIQKNGIAKAEEKDDYAVSNAQKRLWIQSQLSEYSAAYNLVNRSEIIGHYDLKLFEKALQSVISRHEILRTVFRLNNDAEIRQLIVKDTKDSFKIDWKDFSAHPNADHLANLYIEEDKGKTFDLEHGPLFRIAFLRIAEDHYVVYSCMHHIITDGWSFDILIHEIFAFYEAFKAGVNCELDQLRIQYKDYAEWQAKSIIDDQYSTYKKYWIEKISGEIPQLDLPGAKSRPKFLTHNGYRLNSFISPELTNKFRKLCQDEGASLYMGLVAFLNILLYKYTAQQNILIGTPVAGREDSDLEAQIGCFVNTIVLKNTVDPANNFKSFLNSVKDSVLSDFSNQIYPFDLLVEALNLDKNLNRNPIFDIAITMLNTAQKAKQYAVEFDDKIVSGGQEASVFDVEFIFQEVNDCLSFSVRYNTDIYQRADIERLMHHFSALMESVLLDPSVKIENINYLIAAERQELLFDFNA